MIGFNTASHPRRTMHFLATKMIDIMLATLILLGSCAWVQGVQECQADTYCNTGQYCYKSDGATIGFCADFTQCRTYNRQDVPGKPAREALQCGDCLTGYETEELASGKDAEFCKKVEKKLDPNGHTIWIVIGPVLGFVTIVLCLLGGYFLYYKTFTRKPDYVDGNSKELVTMLSGRPGVVNMDISCGNPSAPPHSSSDEYDSSDKNENLPPYSPALNNNKIIRDRNTTVQAVPFKEPYWIDVSPDYNNGQNDDNYNGYGLPSSSPQHLGTNDDTNPSSWTPQPSAEPVTDRPFAQFGTEQAERENATNTVLARQNCPPNNPPTRNGTQEADGSGHRSGGVTLINHGHINLGQINVNLNTDVNFSNDSR